MRQLLLNPITKNQFRLCHKCSRLLEATLENFLVRRNNGKTYLQSMCKSCNQQKLEAWRKAHLEVARASSKRRHHRLRDAALAHYSGNFPKCACCGEAHKEFLAIDHINGGGVRHRKSISNGKCSGTDFFYWLKNNGYPQEFRVLCHNCNMAKGFYGKCPHEG